MKKRLLSIITAFIMVCSFVGVMPKFEFKVEANCTANQILAVAQGEIGTKSGYHQRNKYTLWNGTISGYADGGYGYPWCATFVSWCANQSGCLDIIKRTAGCNVQWAQTSGTKYFVSSGYKPKAGDIIFFDYGTSHSANSLDHVGIVESFDGTTVYTIEGNYDNSVARVARKYNSNDIYGFIAPNYLTENPNLPSKSYIHCSAGTNYTPTSIWWTKSDKATAYDVKIWRDKLWHGDAYKILWSETDLECQLDLPAGYYEAYVDSRNSEGITMSENVVKFTVGEGTPVDIGDDIYAALLINKNWLNVTTDNTNVNVQKETGSGKEIWFFDKQSDGSYTIKNCADGMYLDVYNFTDADGTNVQVCEYNGSDAQKWYIYGRWSGKYYLKPKCANKVLDVNGGKNNPGDNVQIWSLNYSDAQKFAIYPVDKAGQSTLSITAGTSYTNTKFNWTKSSDTNKYVVKIWKNKAWEGSSYKEYSTTGTSWNITLPEGTYQAYVDSCNNYSYTCSNVVTFTVKKGTCTHSYGSWTTSKAATCTAEGSKTRKCSVCNKSETQTITKLGHSLGNWTTKNATCTADGNKTRSCTRAGCTYKENQTIAKLGHSMGNWTTKDATCTADGSKTRSCTRSGCTHKETQTIAKTGHDYITEKISASYTEDGYTKHTCKTCGDSFKDNFVKRPRGDMNNDGNVMIADVVMIQRCLTKTVELSAEQVIAADLNEDGKFNVFDLIIVKRMVLNS